MDVNDLPTDLEELKKLLLQTRSSLLQTQSQIATLTSTVESLSTTVDDQAQKLAAKDHQIIELLKALRGKQRERVDPDQLILFEIGELESLIQEELEESKPASSKRRKRSRRLIPDGLPEEIIEHELPADEHRCPIDGQVMPRIRWEESKQLDYVPATMKVIVHRRAVYACPEKHDESKLVTAPKPPQPIEKGLPAAGLLAQVVVSKFGDHLPAYRQEDIFSRHGIEIRRSTIYGWLAAMAELCRPLVELMQQEVLRSKVIHTDDTQVKLIDKELRGTKLARFWGYLGDAHHPYAVYDFTEDRSRDGPEAFLDGYHGYLQADAYGGYDGIYVDANEADPESGIIEVACWTHCRRYWHKARESSPAPAHHVLAVITRLYEIETATAGESSEVRQAMRAEHAVPLLNDLGKWLDEQVFLPKSLIGKAATYTRNQWKALNRYVEDGDLSIDNNFAERAMRPIAIGRKNWLFVGSRMAGERAGILTSLVASCKNNLVEPWAYLRDLFSTMAYQPTGNQLEELLPDRWLAKNPDHRWEIAERRREERNAKAYL